MIAKTEQSFSQSFLVLAINLLSDCQQVLHDLLTIYSHNFQWILLYIYLHDLLTIYSHNLSVDFLYICHQFAIH